jgi:hypothetical protein
VILLAPGTVVPAEIKTRDKGEGYPSVPFRCHLVYPCDIIGVEVSQKFGIICL